MKNKAISLVLALIMLIFPTAQGAYAQTSGNTQAVINQNPKTILIIATHCDDEANVAYSIVKSNIDAGNTVYMTNYSMSGVRGPESFAAMKVLGLPEENFIVAGVGVNNLNGADSTQPLYYDQPTKDTIPAVGNKKTRGFTDSNTGKNYPSWAAKNMGGEVSTSINDSIRVFADMIKTLHPDEIYCIDQDNHPGHRTTSYIAEEAIASVLKEGSGYTPRVYKGFSYGTAWSAPRDFYTASPDDASRYYLKSTLAPNGTTNDYVYDSRQFTPYKWSERVRFPMPEGLQTADGNNLIFDVMKCYKSQMLDENKNYSDAVASTKAQSVGNGDKVFWERDTRSISYEATVEVSSNEDTKDRINDFKLNDRRLDSGQGNIRGEYANYTWMPAADDTNKQVALSWDSKKDIKRIVLYDDQNLSNQITSGQLQLFADGKEIKTVSVDALSNGGDGTEIILDQTVQADKVIFKILSGTGEYGLSEFEVYTEEGSRERDTEYIKIYLKNKTEDFLYTYPVKILGEDKTLSLGVYRYPDEKTHGNYVWSLPDDADGALSVTNNGQVHISSEIAKGDYTVAVEDTKTGLTDEIVLSINSQPALDIANGSITISEEGFQQEGSKLKKWKDADSHMLTINGTFDGTASGEKKAYYIDIKGGNPTISVEGLTIKQNKSSDISHAAYRCPAILLEKNQNATLIVSGKTTLDGGYEAPAIQINTDAKLKISGKNRTSDILSLSSSTGGNHTAIGAGKSGTAYAAKGEAGGGNLEMSNVGIMAYGAGYSSVGDSDSSFGDITLKNVNLRCYGSVTGAIKLGGKFTVENSQVFVTYGIYAANGYEEPKSNTYDGTGGVKVYKISSTKEGDGQITTWLCRKEGSAVSVKATPAEGYYFESLSAFYTIDNAEKPITITNGSFTMPAYPVTIKAVFKEVLPEESPEAVFSAENMKLTGVSAGMKYQLDDGAWIDIQSKEVDFSSIINAPCTIKVVKKGNGTTTKDSQAQEITITKADAPDLTASQPSEVNGKGSIPTTVAHEFSVDGIVWIRCSGVTEGLEPGTYYIRVAATGTSLASEAQIIEITEHKHNLTMTDEIPATTIDYGVKAYWTCSECGKNFSDAEGKNEIVDLDAWKTGEGRLTILHAWASEWSKDESGHWYACTNCTEKKDFAAHTPGAEATEDTPQTCTVCGYIITPATGHIDHSHRTLVEGQAASCTVDGWKDYYKCNGCDKLFDAETGGNEITLEAWKAGEGKIAAAHKLTKTDEVPATTTQYGVKAFWTCSECDKYFSDAEGKTEIADLEAWKQNEGRIDKKSSGGGGGGSYTPIQKPVIEKNDNVKTELSSDGTKLTIKAEDGYEITDVLVNGVSKGAAGELTGLKTGDKVEIKTAKKAEPIQPTDPSTDKNAKLVKGIENTSIILKSKLTENRKVLLTWTKSRGYKVDSYEVYRSVKKNSGYGKTAFFKTKDGNWSKYLNTKGLKAGKTYYYKVRGVRTIDGQKYYTQWSNKAWRTI